MRVLAIISIFLFCILFGSAQSIDVSKLRNSIKACSDTDTTKILLSLKLGGYYNHNNLDSALYFGYQAIRLSQQLHYIYGECWGYSNLAVIADHSGDMAKSFEDAVTCLHLAEKLKYGRNDLMCKAYTQMGFFEYASGHTHNGIDFLKQAIQLAQEANLPVSAYFQVYSHISRALHIEGDFDSAFIYAKKGYDFSQQSNFSYLKPLACNALGLVLEDQGDTRKALQYFHEAESEAKKINHLFALSNTYNNLSHIFNRSGNADSALYFARASMQIIQHCYFGAYLPEAAKQLSTAYEMMGKPDSALKYLKTMLIVKDSILNQSKRQQLVSMTFEENTRNEKLQAEKKAYIAKIRTLLLIGFLIVLSGVSILLFRNYQIKAKSNQVLEKKSRELEQAMNHLRATQAQLIQSEKMASLGELTAGIAHEIQNPLNFVNNFSDVNKELLQELKDEAEKGNVDEIKAIANDVIENSEKINHHGKRADAIVKGMLQHSRQSSGKKESTDINVLADEYLRLAYHGLRAKDKSFNAKFETDFDPSIGKINIVPQDMGRVILNLINNAFYAVSEKAKQNIAGYEPAVTVSTKKINDNIEVVIADNGNGIPKNIVDKIFQPFFTTKPTGQGTGLGLSLSYDIVKAHGGEIRVESVENEGSVFRIQLSVS